MRAIVHALGPVRGPSPGIRAKQRGYRPLPQAVRGKESRSSTLIQRREIAVSIRALVREATRVAGVGVVGQGAREIAPTC